MSDGVIHDEDGVEVRIQYEEEEYVDIIVDGEDSEHESYITYNINRDRVEVAPGDQTVRDMEMHTTPPGDFDSITVPLNTNEDNE